MVLRTQKDYKKEKAKMQRESLKIKKISGVYLSRQYFRPSRCVLCFPVTICPLPVGI